jgi:chromosomal replication initiation ATPase DnaA
MVFTEQGSAMVSSILQSDRAIAVHIAITRAFVQCRQSIGNYQVLLEEIRAIKGRLDQIDLRNTQQSQIFLEALQKQKPRSPAVTQKQVNYKTRGVVLDKNEVHKVEAIQQAVAKYYKLEPQDLKITSRKRTIALPRQIAIYLIRKHTEIGFSEIGRLFDGKDHTTILHAHRKIDHDFREVASIQKAIQSIQNSLT